MNRILDDASLLVRDFRYGFTVVGLLTFGLLLLVFEDLTPALQNYLVPSVAVYTIGTGVIAGIQLLVTASANTKADANEKIRKKRQEDGLPADEHGPIEPSIEATIPRGIPEKWLYTVLGLHAVWFVLLILYNLWKAVL